MWNSYKKYTNLKRKKSRDVEKDYPRHLFINKLRRLADALETNKSFRIQIKNERLLIPVDAIANIEHERTGKAEELEFQIRWIVK